MRVPTAPAIVDIALTGGAMPDRRVVRGQEGIPSLRAAVRKLDAVFNLCPIQLPPPVIANESAELQKSSLEATPSSVTRGQAVQLALQAEVFGSVDGVRVAALLQPIGVDQARGKIAGVGENCSDEAFFVAHACGNWFVGQYFVKRATGGQGTTSPGRPLRCALTLSRRTVNG
jgi:hypothetical protein